MMNSKTIAALPLLLLVPAFAKPAEARGPEAKDRRLAATAHAAPVAAPAPPPPAPVDDRSAASRDAQPRTETAESADKAGRTTSERDDSDVAPDGFSIAARVGYALPMGTLAKDASLQGANDFSRTASGMVPFWGEIGYRLNEHWYVGGYFQLGIVGTANDLCNQFTQNGNNTNGTNTNGNNTNGSTGCSSSGTDIRFGGTVRYTFKRGGTVSPWVGLSSGYEILNISVTGGPNTIDGSAKGWEFIGLHLGGDFKPAPQLSVGPILAVSFGQYGGFSKTVTGPQASTQSADYTNPALHEWIFFGLRGQYDL